MAYPPTTLQIQIENVHVHFVVEMVNKVETI